MVTLKRFVNVRAPGHEVVHRLYSQKMVAGELTQCGIRIQKGWRFGPSMSSIQSPHIGVKLRRCKRCDR